MSVFSKIVTYPCVPLTSLVPKQWEHWFYAVISDNAPFSWGDNDHTLVNAQFFANHCEERVLDEVGVEAIAKPWAAREWLKKIRRIPDGVYVDLEC